MEKSKKNQVKNKLSSKNKLLVSLGCFISPFVFKLWTEIMCMWGEHMYLKENVEIKNYNINYND